MKRVGNILLIDDNIADNEFHTIVIQRAGVTDHLECITSSRKALEYLTQSLMLDDNADFPAPNLVFLDINMPAMNGFELLDKLRLVPDRFNRKKRIRIFMLTGSLNPDDYNRATEEYSDLISGFRIKPLVNITFREIVEHYFGSHL